MLLILFYNKISSDTGFKTTKCKWLTCICTYCRSQAGTRTTITTYKGINLFYTNVGIDYKLNKFIKISPTYRAIQKKRLEGTYSYRHRLMLDVTVKKKFNKFTLSERVRYQAEVQDLYTSKKGKLTEQFLEEVKQTQATILNDYSTMLKPGGLMVYATCSILPEENNLQVEKFLMNNKGKFEFVDEKKFYASVQGFDGFYMALLKKV